MQSDVRYAEANKLSEITLNNIGLVVAVDDEDFAWLNQRTWHGQWSGRNGIRRTAYAYRTQHFICVESGEPKTRQIAMHREILGLTNPSIKCDHKNGDGLDNRRDNLRIATPGQNAANRKMNRNNRTGLKGVCFVPRTGMYKAQLRIAKKTVLRATFSRKEDAYAAYCAACAQHNGEFARTQ